MTAAEGPAQQVDALVIGSGQAGTPLARMLAASGRTTILVESAEVGGTCVNVGCTPTKTMVASARVADVVRRAAGYGVKIPSGPIEIDIRQVRARKDATVRSWRTSSERSIHDTSGLTLLRGVARFVGPHSVRVDGALLEAPLIFIDPGMRPTMPSLPGLDTIAWLDSTSIMELEEVPEH